MADENIDEHQFLWQIENFSACTDRFLTSPVIRARNLYDSKWNLMLSITDNIDGRFIHVQLRRRIRNHVPTDLHLDFDVCLIDLHGEEHFKQKGSCAIKRDLVASFKRFVKRSHIFEDNNFLLPNDVLTLLFRARKSDRGMFNATRSVVCTKIQVERSAFLWTIRGLTRKPLAIKRVIHIESSAVISGLELTCKCDNTIGEQNTLGSEYVVRLAIKPKDVPKDRIFMAATILAQNRHLNALAKIETEHFFEARSTDTWHLPSFGISDRMGSLQEGDRLDLVCNFSISDGSQDKKIEGTLILLTNKLNFVNNTLLQDIRSVYESNINFASDILLVADNGEQHFQAHKIILSARSVVFREILNRYDVEKRRFFDLSGTDANSTTVHNEVRHESIKVYVKNGMDCADILQTCPYIVAKMLKCMYTDTLKPDNVTEAIQLYSAGVQFDFSLLRVKSESYLKSKISLMSLYQILHFANLNGIVRLKWECLNFISRNRKLILFCDKWFSLWKGQDDLAEDISNILKSEESSSC